MRRSDNRFDGGTWTQLLGAKGFPGTEPAAPLALYAVWHEDVRRLPCEVFGGGVQISH